MRPQDPNKHSTSEIIIPEAKQILKKQKQKEKSLETQQTLMDCYVLSMAANALPKHEKKTGDSRIIQNILWKE